ncbi:hypothetical protein IEQ34_009182 [Dendrobium chrysotoxum]|uniref:Uncharacterized protein n=1 Tax=Dendrobium chrysotoxum TaxID=161865 RepID=A0AAV7GYI4_DENCH|nr:hypothetical protein IEQ34_009182 [Dendrobium chrysotoxum]
MATQVSMRYWSGLLLLTMCFLSCASGGGGVATATATAMRRQKLETKRHLNKLNKPAVKSFKVLPFSSSLLQTVSSFFRKASPFFSTFFKSIFLFNVL